MKMFNFLQIPCLDEKLIYRTPLNRSSSIWVRCYYKIDCYQTHDADLRVILIHQSPPTPYINTHEHKIDHDIFFMTDIRNTWHMLMNHEYTICRNQVFKKISNNLLLDSFAGYNIKPCGCDPWIFFFHQEREKWCYGLRVAMYNTLSVPNE